jgi:hypothetical protein
MGDMPEIEKSLTALMERGPKRISPFTVPTMIPENPSCVLILSLNQMNFKQTQLVTWRVPTGIVGARSRRWARLTPSSAAVMELSFESFHSACDWPDVEKRQR